MSSITLWGAVYDTDYVDLPKTGGGTARFSEGGGSGYTRTVIAVEQTVTPTSNGTYYSATLNVTDGFEADAEYIITFNGTEYFFTCQVMWGNNYLLGDINYFYGGSDLPYPFGIIWMNGTTCTLARDNGNQVTVKIEKLELTGSGGGGSSTLITKTITENGTYDAEDDNADGYSSVTVNVPSSGGSSNIVTGTFTGTTTGTVLDVNVNYSGIGYPIAIFVVPTGGMFGNTTYNSLVRRYAIGYFSAYKTYVSQTPTYQNNGTENQYSICSGYKNSTSAANNYTRTFGPNTVITYGTSADPSGALQSLLFRTNKKFSVRIASTSYGFAANIEYTYHIIYSS